MHSPEVKKDDFVKKNTLDKVISIWHLIMALLFMASWATGMMAAAYEQNDYADHVIIIDIEDGKLEGGVKRIGFIVHGCAGMTTFLCLLFYFGYGVHQGRFFHCFPFTVQQLRKMRSDLITLVHCRVPEYRKYQGIAGLVHFTGILIICWFGISGLIMYFFIEPPTCVPPKVLALQEAHEKGYFLPLVYLGLHVCGVFLHILSGRTFWKEMLFLPSQPPKPKK